MKHTDFYKLIEEIKLQEQCELKAAIKSVGGCYIWDIYDGEAEYPIIAVNMDSISLNPTDVEIYEVQIVNNVLKIKGRDKESREVVEFEPNDVFAGHLSYIIDYTGLEDKECEKIKRFLEIAEGYPVDVDWETQGFYRCNDAGTLPGECADFIFHKCND